MNRIEELEAEVARLRERVAALEEVVPMTAARIILNQEVRQDG